MPISSEYVEQFARKFAKERVQNPAISRIQIIKETDVMEGFHTFCEYTEVIFRTDLGTESIMFKTEELFKEIV